MSIKEIKKRLEVLDKVDFKNVIYEKYFEYLKDTFQGYTQALVSMTINYEDGESGIFRAREVFDNQPFIRADDLWARPEKDVDKFGRCHNIGQSKLYCSNHLATALIECRAKENSQWVVVEYDIIPNINFSMLPVGMKPDRYIKITQAPKLINTLDPHGFKKNTLIEKYIRNSFKQYVGNDTFKYMKTFAITDYLLKNDQARNSLFGLIFPSVPSSFCGTNFCFDSKVARQVLTIKKINYIKFKNFDHQKGKFYYAVLANGVIADEKLSWI